jgi:hypothetical protein
MMGGIKITKGWIRSIKFSINDIEPLIDWSIEVSASGPVFLTTLAGISLMSGICYGRPVNDEEFIKFAVFKMGIGRVFADALYKSWMSYHSTGSWASGVRIFVSDKAPLFRVGCFEKRNSLDINVVELARLYLSTVTRMNIIEGE